MKFTVNESPWVTLRNGDTGFRLDNGITVCDRAGIEITNTCPSGMATVIADAWEKGWIRPVAVVPKSDPTLIWETIKNER